MPSVTFYVKTGVTDEGAFCRLLCKDRSDMRVPSVTFYVKTGVR